MSLSQTISQTDSLLDERQVARMIGMSIGSLRRWRLVGQGPPFIRVGRRGVRYKPEDLASWLDSRPVGGAVDHITSSCAPGERSMPSTGVRSRSRAKNRGARNG